MVREARKANLVKENVSGVFIYLKERGSICGYYFTFVEIHY